MGSSFRNRHVRWGADEAEERVIDSPVRCAAAKIWIDRGDGRLLCFGRNRFWPVRCQMVASDQVGESTVDRVPVILTGGTIGLLREPAEERNASVEDILRVVVEGGYMVAAVQLDVGLITGSYAGLDQRQ